MSDVRDLDLLRAAHEGRLPADERRVLDERLRHEPGLASMANDLGGVWAVTDDPLPGCDLSFEHLDLEAGPSGSPWSARRPVWVAVAACAAVFLVAFLAWRPDRSGPRSDELGSVVLSAIPLEPVKGPKPMDVPAALAAYDPMGPAGLRFVEGLEAGRLLARWTGRPLLLFVRHPDCPLCLALASGTFKDPSLASHVEPFVLAQATYEDLDPSLFEGVKVGWPIFLVYGLDGRRIDAFGGAPGASELARALDGAAAKRSSPGEVLPWVATREAAQAYREASAAKDEATRHEWLARVRTLAGASPLGAAARTYRTALDGEARRTLLEARDAAAAGRTKEALAALDAALARYRSTPYERDLTAVRTRLAAGHPFPTLEAPR